MEEKKQPTVSPKMKRGVDMCEKILGIKCSNKKDFNTVKEFLNENMPKVRDKDLREYKEITDKQRYAIDFIEAILDVEFEGENMKQASEFISQYYEKAKEIRDARK